MEKKSYLKKFGEEFNIQDINESLDSLKNIRVLVIGDAILDEYVYCDFMERTSKEPIIATKFNSSELMLGGVFSMGNHISNFVEEVTLISLIGDNHKDFIRKNLRQNINRVLLKNKIGKTLVNRRYIDSYRKRKLFEIYSEGFRNTDKDNEEKIISYLEDGSNNFDLLIVADYGHGFITPKIIKKILGSSIPFALNTQLNGGNWGYNFVTKYEKSNFILLNEREIRLPTQERYLEIPEVIKKLREIRKFESVLITLGKKGAIYSPDSKTFFSAPSFVESVEDTVGCGDAVFSLTSLLNFRQVNPKIVLFLGNLLGALHTKIMGNKRFIKQEELKSEAKELL